MCILRQGSGSTMVLLPDINNGSRDRPGGFGKDASAQTTSGVGVGGGGGGLFPTAYFLLARFEQRDEFHLELLEDYRGPTQGSKTLCLVVVQCRRRLRHGGRALWLFQDDAGGVELVGEVRDTAGARLDSSRNTLQHGRQIALAIDGEKDHIEAALTWQRSERRDETSERNVDLKGVLEAFVEPTQHQLHEQWQPLRSVGVGAHHRGWRLPQLCRQVGDGDAATSIV
mmetsp:Transcript_63408/g.137941  ORF Transcript_63408/g.137941 Transcript_63408/m.137941 type:complete len:227 (-) Transcript_63408:92-772(-)